MRRDLKCWQCQQIFFSTTPNLNNLLFFDSVPHSISNMDTTNTLPNRQLMAIASEVSGVADNVVPRVLVKMQAILDSEPQGSRALGKIRRDIWSLGLTQVTLTTLKQDFSKILNGWDLAGKLAKILCLSCIGLEQSEDESFMTKFIPDVLQTLLMLGHKIQAKYVKTSDILEDTKKDLLSHLKIVLDSLGVLCSGPDKLAQLVLVSPWLLQMLLTDDLATANIVTSLVQSLNRVKTGLCGSLSEKNLHQILDELVFKLSLSTKTDMAAAACRTLTTMCDSHPPIVELMCKRYKGLLPILSAWNNKGFDRDLHRLEMLLEAGSMRQAQLQKKHEAAMVVQAWWRSYHTRKRIKKAGQAMSTFQLSFRARRQQRDDQKVTRRAEMDLRHMLLMNRRKAMRDLRGRRLQALQILPAGEVEKFIEQENQQAAVNIQRMWRGHQVRQSMPGHSNLVVKTRAVVKIQRMVRTWLDRVHTQRREPPAWQRPPGLTDARRVKLHGDIVEWRETHEVETQGEEAKKELHYRVQEMIKQFAMSSRKTRKLHQHRELLLARLESDADLLMNAPKLCDADENDIEIFNSRSVPIATKARYNHTQELRLLRQPWWRKLGDEYQDQKLEEDSEMWKLF